MKGQDRVVIEYDHCGYSEPSDEQAYFLDCAIVSQPAGSDFSETDLAALRSDLEIGGYRLDGAHPTKKRQAGRFFPHWHEVWVKSEDAPCALRRESDGLTTSREAIGWSDAGPGW
jgi:hypothetical protein